MGTKFIPAFLTAAVLAAAASILPAQSPAENTVPAVAGLPAGAQAAAAAIDGEKIRAHVRFLSLDLLEGRGPGTRGGELAAEYIATQFALAGVEPAGDNGTYFQRVPLYAVHTVEDKTKFSFVPADGAALDLAYGDEIVAKDQTGQATADIDAPIVFVGYGIDAPEYHWNDYAGPDGKDIDLKGKVVLVIVNEPPSNDEKFFKGKALTYYGRWTYKYEEAARRGAAGVLIIHREDLASYGWDVVRNSQAVEKSYLDGDPNATLRAAAWIQHDVAQKLFTMAGLGDLDKAIDRAGVPGAFHAVELPVRLKAHIESRVRRYVSANVVGRVKGEASGGNRGAVYGALRSSGDRPRHEGRQHFQRRCGQRNRMRNCDGAGACLCAVAGEAAARCVFCFGDGRGTGAAGVAVSGDASAGSSRADGSGFELRHAAADRDSAVGESDRRGAD